MSDELVFTVAGDAAHAARPISLVEAGLREREHLQEWVLHYPTMLGDGVLVVTFEFDQWQRHDGTREADRLDVLGLDQRGHLVVAELKRDTAPEPTALQAIKYAAMASRFTLDDLARLHAQFLKTRGDSLADDEARERLEAHVEYEIDAETLSKPRIVLLAAEFPPTLTATVVWLTEMGMDITLRQFKSYRTESETLLTVSQLYPVRDVEEFTIAPRLRAAPGKGKELPVVAWSEGDIVALSESTSNPTILTALEVCATRAGELISFSELCELAGRTTGEARGDLAALTMLVKRRFRRSNWPFSVEWAAGGESQAYYRMDEHTAAIVKHLLPAKGVTAGGSAEE